MNKQKKGCCVHETEMAMESTQNPKSSLNKQEKEKRGKELGHVKNCDRTSNYSNSLENQ